MIAVIRLRSGIKSRKDVIDTLNMLGLRKINTLSLLPENNVAIGMIRKVEDYVTWGSASGEIVESFKNRKIAGLKPPKGGLRSIKKHYPKGDLGFRGEAINELIKRMM